MTLCDKEYEASEHSSQRTFSSQIKDGLKNGHHDNSDSDLNNDSKQSQDHINIVEDPISNDSYSVLSPTFSDVDGVTCNSCQRYFFDSVSRKLVRACSKKHTLN